MCLNLNTKTAKDPWRALVSPPIMPFSLLFLNKLCLRVIKISENFLHEVFQLQRKKGHFHK